MNTAGSQATSSIFASKAAPRGVVSAANDYGLMCKFVMKQRLIRVLLFSFFTNWVLVTFSMNFSFRALADIRLLGFAGTSFCFVVLPPLVLHKLSLSPVRASSTPVPSPLGSRIKSLLNHPKNWRFAVVCAATALINAWLFSIHGSSLSVFSPTHRYPFHLNETFVLLCASNISLGVLYGVQTVISARTRVCWPSLPITPGLALMTSYIAPRITQASILSITNTLSFTFLAFLFRRVAYRIALNFLGILFRPYIAHFLHPKAHSAMTFHTLFCMLVINLATTVSWDISLSLLEFYSALPLDLSHNAPSPNQAVLSGIHSPNGFVQHHAFHDLSLIAASTTPQASLRRRDLLGDLKYSSGSGNASPGMWAAVSRQCLLILGKDLQTLKMRGKAPPPPIAALPAQPKVTAPATPFNSSIYRSTPMSTRETVIDSLGSEGATTRAVSDLVDTVGSARVPKLFLSQSQSGPGSSLAGVTRKTISPVAVADSGRSLVQYVISAAKGTVPKEWMKNLEDSDVYHSLFVRGTLLGVAEMSLPNVALDCWVIQSLSYLTSNSLQDDKYGVVQRDIPRILEALLTFLDVLEGLISQLEKERKDLFANVTRSSTPESDTGGAVDPRIEREEAEWTQVELVYQPLRDALREGIHVIVAAFRDRLTVFKFPVGIAKQLQEIMDR